MVLFLQLICFDIESMLMKFRLAEEYDYLEQSLLC